jgi:hypothetical protein
VDRDPATPAAAPVVTPPPAPVPPAVPAPDSDRPASPAAAVVAEATARSTAVDRSDRSVRTDRKKHPSSGSRVTPHNPEPAVTAEPEPEPEPPAPTPAPGPPVARPPVTEPPPAERPRTVPKPAPAPPREPPVVSATAVSKRSGAIPAIKVSKVNGGVGEFADVVVKLCIDEQGAVSSVKVVKAPPAIADELQHGLQGWRYTPYVNAAGVQTAACFPVSFRVVFKS